MIEQGKKATNTFINNNPIRFGIITQNKALSLKDLKKLELT